MTWQAAIKCVEKSLIFLAAFPFKLSRHNGSIEFKTKLHKRLFWRINGEIQLKKTKKQHKYYLHWTCYCKIILLMFIFIRYLLDDCVVHIYMYTFPMIKFETFNSLQGVRFTKRIIITINCRQHSNLQSSRAQLQSFSSIEL